MRLFSRQTPTVPTPIPELPIEVWDRILQFVGEPARTSLVCRLWCVATKKIHPYIIQRCRQYPELAPWVEAVARVEQEKQLRALATNVLNEANRLQIPSTQYRSLRQKTDVQSPVFLVRVCQLMEVKRRATTMKKFCSVIDSWFFYKSFRCEATSAEAILTYCFQWIAHKQHHFLPIKSMVFADDLCLPKEICFFKNLTSLNLKGCTFRTLPSEMRELAKLEDLYLGTGLDPANVIAVCRTLPNLKKIIIWETETALLVQIKNLKNDLPDLELYLMSNSPDP